MEHVSVPKLIILGSSNAVSDEQHENTHMVLVGQQRSVLIDCPGNPIRRLAQSGVDQRQITDLILTHFHPDHVSGVGLFLMDAWLLGRKALLDVYGLAYTIDRAAQQMESYDWKSWPNFFQVAFHRLPEEEMVLALENEEFRIYTSIVKHIIPTIGIRIEAVESGRVITYSCDTEPCPQVERLASGADVLIHESAGPSYGHTSPAQAGEIASQSGAKSLYLIHYPTRGTDPEQFVQEAQKSFHGPVSLAKDFLELDL